MRPAAILTTSSGESIPAHTIFLAATPLVTGELGSKGGTSIKDNAGEDENWEARVARASKTMQVKTKMQMKSTESTHIHPQSRGGNWR